MCCLCFCMSEVISSFRRLRADVCENYVGSVYVGENGGLSESGLFL